MGKLDLGSKYHGVKTLLCFIHNLLVSLQTEYCTRCGANKYPRERGKYAWKYPPLVKALARVCYQQRHGRPLLLACTFR